MSSKVFSTAGSSSAVWIDSSIAYTIAVSSTVLTLALSAYHISDHLRNWTMPTIQILIIRILLTCPIYACTSAASLALGAYDQGRLYPEVVRDLYEAVVISSFLNLILEFSGGESDCVYQIENKAMLKMPFPLCCLPTRSRDARLMRLCRRGVLQFMIVKVSCATVALALIATGNYFNFEWQILLTSIYNISYALAMYSLFVFYLATKELLKTFRPLSKFTAVKVIVFATYYQSLLVTLAPIPKEQGMKWNNLLLCLETVLFAVGLMIAFPKSEFVGGIPDRHVLQNIKGIFTVQDIKQDIYINFMPAYQDYALQRSQNEAPEVVKLKTFFVGNLNPVALEMTSRYRGVSKRANFNALLRSIHSSTLRRTLNAEEFFKDVSDTSSSADTVVPSWSRAGDERAQGYTTRSPLASVHTRNSFQNILGGPIRSMSISSTTSTQAINFKLLVQEPLSAVGARSQYVSSGDQQSPERKHDLLFDSKQTQFPLIKPPVRNTVTNPSRLREPLLVPDLNWKPFGSALIDNSDYWGEYISYSPSPEAPNKSDEP